MARVGIDVSHAIGVSMPNIRAVAKRCGIDQELADQLWDTGIHEARILATLVADPEALTAERMNTWAADITSWDLCDAAADVFGHTSIVERTIRSWATSPQGYVKRCAFSMIARRAVWDEGARDREFLGYLALIRRGATDQRNEVKKGVSWALRQIGKRNATLHGAAVEEAERLVATDVPPARWIGRDALRELRSTEVLRRLSRRNVAPIRTPRA